MKMVQIQIQIHRAWTLDMDLDLRFHCRCGLLDANLHTSALRMGRVFDGSGMSTHASCLRLLTAAMSTAFRALLLPHFPKLSAGVGTWCVACGFKHTADGQATIMPVTTFGAQSDSAVWKRHLLAKHKTLYDTIEQKHTGKRPAAAAVAAVDLESDVNSVVDLIAVTVDTPAAKRAKVAATTKSSSGASSHSSRNAAVSYNPIRNLFASCSQGAVLASFVRWLAVSSIAHNAAVSSECRNFLLALGWSGSLPSAEALKAERGRQAEELRNTLGSKLAHRTVTMACDGWTNVRSSKVTNVVVIVDGRAYYWCSIVNAEERNTAEWMAARLLPVILTLTREWDARVAGFAVDNEAVNFSCLKQLRKDVPPLLHIPCAAHTLQLIVHSCLEHAVLAATVQQLTALIRHFDAKEHRVALLQLQRARNVKQLRIVKPCDTRWNSLLAAAQRMLQLEAEARCCFTLVHLPSITSEFWNQLRALVDFLEPFRVATDALQSDAATLLTVYEQFVLLQKHIQEQHSWAAESIMVRWNKHVNIPAVTATAVLSFVKLPPQLSMAKAQKFILDWGTRYLHYYHLVHEDDSLRDTRDTLTAQLADFQGRLGGFAAMNEHMESLRRKACAAAPFQAKKVWLLHSDFELSKVAVALLTLAPSEASVERSFSAQGSVHTKLRNRMADSSVQHEMFIKFNSRLLSPSPVKPSTSAVAATQSDSLPPVANNVVELDPAASDSDESISDSENDFLFARRRQPRAAAASAAAAMDEGSDADTDADNIIEEAEEQNSDAVAGAAIAAAVAATAVPSGAARRAARRSESIVFRDVNTFLAWFIRTRHLSASSVINADVHNDLQQNSQSKLPIANAPSTKELTSRIRLLLQQPSAGAAAALCS